MGEQIKNMAGEVVKTLEPHPNLAEALAAFQAEIPSVKKGNQATIPGKEGKPGFKYDYADLSDITEAALPLLGRHGLAWTTKPTMAFGGDASFVLEYQLRHGASGEVIEGIYPLPDPMRTAPQALGAAITYARRYCLVAVTGVAPGGDDDDAHAAQPHVAASRRECSVQAPAAPVEVPKPSRDWTVPALAAQTYEELRAVHAEADALGELGLSISGDGETVGQMLRRRKAFLESRAAKEASRNGSGSGTRDFVGEARAARTREALVEILDAAVAAGVSREVQAEISSFEDSLPAEASMALGDETDWSAAAGESGEPVH